MATQRFLTLDDVAEILNVSWSQAYALVRRKELIAIQIGGRGQWRGGKGEAGRFFPPKDTGAPGGGGADDAGLGGAAGGTPQRQEVGCGTRVDIRGGASI